MSLRFALAVLISLCLCTKAETADFLIAMSNDNPNASSTAPMIRSIAYDPSNNYAVTNQKDLLTGFSSALGVATLNDALYVSNNSRAINGYKLTLDGSGNVNAAALPGFSTIAGTTGQFFRGISVNSSSILASYTNAVTTVALYDPTTGAAGSPATFTGATNKWKAVQAPGGNIYVVSTTQINVYDSAGTSLGALNVTGTGMRDIVFQNSTTFYVSDFSGGNIRKYILASPTSASIDASWGGGTFSTGGAYGLALSSDSSQLFYSRFFSDTTNHSQIGRLSTSNAANNTLITSVGNPYGYQYLAVVTVVPEASSLVLGFLGAAACISGRLLKRKTQA